MLDLVAIDAKGHRIERPLLSMTDVVVTYASGAVRAVDGVSLEVARGEVVALVGESGCGKTTLIRSALGLAPLAGGTIEVDGSAVDGRQRSLRAIRRRAQMIFQDPTGALNPRHTVYEAVAEGIRIHRVAGNEADLVATALSRAGLRPRDAIHAALPARNLRRPAAAGIDRRCDRPRPGAAARRRAGGVTRRVRSAARSWRCCGASSMISASRSSR